MRKVAKYNIQGFIWFILVAVLALTGCSASDNNKSDDLATTPKYVFYFIGDGMGASHRTLAEGYMQYHTSDDSYQLAMNQMPVQSNINTRSLTNEVTDSAASGTALATGEKTGTGVIGMDIAGEVEYTSILKSLQDKGMSVGLITTVTITHATPAAFGANIADRNDEAAIAEQYLANEYDYLAGGGTRYFLSEDNGGKRDSGDDLIADFEELGYTVDTSITEYEDTDFSCVEKYLGIYEDKYLTDVITQENNNKTSPTLTEMVSNGIQVLLNNEDGFFMMVEGGYIDGASHNNDTPTVLHEVLALDDAVKVALEFYEKYPEDTLIIVTADHETGGISLGYNSYSINYEPLDSITVSFSEEIEPYINDSDFDGFFNAMEEGWNVILSDEDKQRIMSNIENFDMRKLASEFGMDEETIVEYESMKHMFGTAGYASSFVLSNETSIAWATQAHTAEPVPLTAIGAGSDNFGSCSDNTHIPQRLAELLKVEIGDLQK